jgi:hypothetical protein
MFVISKLDEYLTVTKVNVIAKQDVMRTLHGFLPRSVNITIVKALLKLPHYRLLALFTL